MSNVKKLLILTFVLFPGFALADGEPSVTETTPTEAVLTVKPVDEKPEVKLDLATLVPTVKIETEKKKEAPKPVEPKVPEPIVHEVQSGDTLTSIGETHQTTWERVYDTNPQVENPDVITPGDKLRIPRPDEKIAPRNLPATPAAPVAQTAVATTTTHTQVRTVAQTSELIGSYGYVTGGSNCVNTAKAYGKNQPGNPINWSPTTQTPFIGAAVLFYFNHVAIVTGIHSDGSVEVTHQNCPGCPTRYYRSQIRGFF